MNWSLLLPWRWVRAKKLPIRRAKSTARLVIETLEDRLVPSTTTTDLAYQLWRQQTFRLDDVAVASKPTVSTQATTVPQNASFGSMIGLPSVFSGTSYRGQGYSVAVIDTGIDYNNPALGGGFGPGHRVIAGWDFVNNDADPMDDNGHGTHVAGIIGSSDATYSGIAPNVNLIALKVLSASGSGTFANVQSALDWVVANRSKYNIVAINLSLGSGNYTSNPYTYLDTDFNALKNAGVFMSVAAGNSFYSLNSAAGLDYPAIDPLVVSVGAVYDGNFGQVAWASGARDYTTAQDRVASFSQRSSTLSIMAPGAMITSTYLKNAFQAMAGTSMASPVIAGAAVIIHQAMDSMHLTANQSTILALMKKTGVNVVDGDDENDNVTNTGLTFKRIDLGAAISSLGTPSNSAPVLQPIGNQNVSPGGTVTIRLSATDPNGDPITYSATVLGAGASQAYQLKQQLGLKYLGTYYQNTWGQNEKWMTSDGGTWYCILPNGAVRRWTGSMTTTLQATNLVATLDARFYTDPSLLWNAQPSATPTVSVSGNQLTVQAPAGSGTYQIQVSASDGTLASTQTFTVTIQAKTAPVIAAVASQSMAANRSLTLNLNATDAQNDAITYTAQLVGSFASPPASLVVNGKQLTIYSSAGAAGSFDIQVTASDGSLSSSTTIHVNVTASNPAFRLNGDFNGDGVKDAATFEQDGTCWVSLIKADGSFVNQQWAHWSPASYWGLLQMADVNGDGKSDIVGFYTDGGWYVGLSTGASFAPSQLWGKWSAPSTWRSYAIADCNGDGKADIVGYSSRGTWYVGQSTGAAFADALWASWDPTKNWTYVQTGDFNGDGKTDILGFNASGDLFVGTSTGAGFSVSLWTQWTAASNWTSFTVDDVNSDGKLDFLALNANGKWYVAYSTGTSFSTQVGTPPGR